MGLLASSRQKRATQRNGPTAQNSPAPRAPVPKSVPALGHAVPHSKTMVFPKGPLPFVSH